MKAKLAALFTKMKELFGKLLSLGGGMAGRMIMVGVGTFLIAVGAIFFVGRNAALHKARALQATTAIAAAVHGSTSTVAGSEVSADTSTVTAAAAPETSATASLEKELAQLNESELLDNRIIAFIIHSYEEQKVKLKEYDDKFVKMQQQIDAQKGLIDQLTASQQAAAVAQQQQQAAAAPKPRPSAQRGGDEIKRLADLYSQMRADEVSEIAQKLDDDTLVKVFAKMKSKTVAKILANFDTERVARLNMKMIKSEE